MLTKVSIEIVERLIAKCIDELLKIEPNNRWENSYSEKVKARYDNVKASMYVTPTTIYFKLGLLDRHGNFEITDHTAFDMENGAVYKIYPSVVSEFILSKLKEIAVLYKMDVIKRVKSEDPLVTAFAAWKHRGLPANTIHTNPYTFRQAANRVNRRSSVPNIPATHGKKTQYYSYDTLWQKYKDIDTMPSFHSEEQKKEFMQQALAESTKHYGMLHMDTILAEHPRNPSVTGLDGVTGGLRLLHSA